jgi:hypothetical protein
MPPVKRDLLADSQARASSIGLFPMPFVPGRTFPLLSLDLDFGDDPGLNAKAPILSTVSHLPRKPPDFEHEGRGKGDLRWLNLFLEDVLDPISVSRNRCHRSKPRSWADFLGCLETSVL